MRNVILGILFVVWLLTTSVGIIFWGNQGLRYFDPQLKLATKLMDLDFEQHFVGSLPSATSSQIFHILDPQCPCTFVNNFHRSALNTWAEKYGIKQTQINLSDYPQLTRFVPSTPAVAVVDENQHLVYFGPYSEGAGCLQNKGLVDGVIKPVFEEGENIRSQIRSEAYGCYCEV